MTALHPKHRVHFLGLNQPRPGTGVRMDDAAARLARIMGDLRKGGKTSFTKVKLCRTGKLNRTICRIEIFFFTFPFLELKPLVCETYDCQERLWIRLGLVFFLPLLLS